MRVAIVVAIWVAVALGICLFIHAANRKETPHVD